MASNVPPTVLLVEDDEPLADLYADWLRDDYHVEVAHGGEPALERLAEGASMWCYWTATCRTSPVTRSW